MHRPPAVSWDVGAARGQRQVLMGLLLCAALLLLGFVVTQPWGLRPLVLLTLLLGCMLVAARASRQAPQGRLQWDGEQWHWSGHEDLPLTSLVWVLDLQRLLLLHIRCAQGPALWLWLEAGDDRKRWTALRRALVSSRQIAERTSADALPP